MLCLMVRARPLAPEDRRASIIEATRPLLLEFGPQLSSRQIADAAGIAEGTLFRAFPTKEAIVSETMRCAMDPGPMIAKLDQIDRALPLQDRVRQAVGIVGAGVAEVSQLMTALFRSGGERPPSPHGPKGRYGSQLRSDRQRLTAALAGVLEGDAARLETDLSTAAAFVNSLCFASAHPMLSEGQLSDADLLTRLILKALLKDET